ncbi:MULTISPECIES: TRAP transporter small permease [unclassified Salinibacterium]|uniref:TRAP transporter small permease n=1 Tax=unclassified Salinibacterium TaxID=2632331 RepID=UPI0018CD90BC|nr:MULTISPECIES: TRAP transporter small permease subunit [unclassified Salinibacterium]MBH0023015.1 TRAP transporter small permease subunit [Salinibacterium sp. SWN248]MBH0053037.1 TRAP transporter small permease subunit [Salinibacterium sp. SWN139]MBH0082301.1 TRAP transporter small permease subunit [Salinibacterium sp. SWN167]
MSQSAASPPTVGGIIIKLPDRPAKRFAHRATFILEVIASALIFVMMLIVLVNVISRYAFGQPIQGTNEQVGFILLPAVVFIGYVVAQVRGATIEADIVYQKFPRQIRREVRFVTGIFSMIVTFGFGWYGMIEAIHANEIGKSAPASDVFIAPIYWFVPAAFAVLVVLFALDAFRAIRGRFDKEDFTEEALTDAAIG